MKVFIGMETSGVMRRAFAARGHDVVSCDFLPCEDNSRFHMQMDVFEALDRLWMFRGWRPDLAIFHPTCTYLTCSAEWAYGPGPYHQKVKPGTLVGTARTQARLFAIAEFQSLLNLPIDRIAIENPVGVMSRLHKPTQIVQPWWFGDDASKATCLWLKNLRPLLKDNPVAPRMVGNKPRWGNQTDSGQNRLSPGPNRWKDRARTYPGFARACAVTWG
jgi:hypothetical protein